MWKKNNTKTGKVVSLEGWSQFYSLGGCFLSNYLVVFQFLPVEFELFQHIFLHCTQMKGHIACSVFLKIWFFAFLLLAADGTMKRKKVILQSFTLRRSSTNGNSPGQLDSGAKIALFGQPLAIICGEDDTLPQPVQVSKPGNTVIILLASSVRQDPQYLFCRTQEMTDFGVSPPHTLLISSGPIPDVERIRCAGFVQPTQLEVTLSGYNPGPGIGICDSTEVI